MKTPTLLAMPVLAMPVLALPRLALAVLALTGCGLLAPLPEATTLDLRLAQFPTENLDLDRPVEVRWNENQVPWITAESDRDLAYALGLVQGHLRLGQITFLKRVSQGRIAESGGPLAVDFDEAIRGLDFGRAAGEIEANLPEATRVWLEAFVAGLNHAQDKIVAERRLPMEFPVLGFATERFTVQDILTIGRIVSIDINWGRYINLLPLRERDDWADTWATYLETGAAATPSYDPESPARLRFLTEFLENMSKTGSNAFAIAGSRTATGGAMIASDPHLGITAPSTWVLVGIRTPTQEVVGFMPPGLPLIGIGRNRDIAWGGTNMHSANSDFVDVSDLPPQAFRDRVEPIRVRWWFDTERTIRETDYGPVISDSALIDTSSTVALRWIGHLPSDEFSAMLGVHRADDFDGFRSALSKFALSPQNFVYADDEGRVGLVTATHLPDRPLGFPDDVLQEPDGPNDWNRIWTASELPAVVDPPGGFISSANNPPADSPVPIGYFFSTNDRVERLDALLSDTSNGPMTFERFAEIQRDVYSAKPHGLARLLVEKAAAAQAAGWQLPEELAPTLAAIGRWNGYYDADNAEAVAAEVALVVFFQEFFTDEATQRRFRATARPRELGRPLIEAADPMAVAAALEPALKEAARASRRYATWGEMHRLIIAHPLGLIPVIGGRFRYRDLPTPGSSDTIFKTSHRDETARHRTRFGANARHISDMGDPDANYFVILGGQDETINSSTSLDQLALWEAGDFIRMPLSRDLIEAEFGRVMTLSPGG